MCRSHQQKVAMATSGHTGIPCHDVQAMVKESFLLRSHHHTLRISPAGRHQLLCRGLVPCCKRTPRPRLACLLLRICCSSALCLGESCMLWPQPLHRVVKAAGKLAALLSHMPRRAVRTPDRRSVLVRICMQHGLRHRGILTSHVCLCRPASQSEAP